MTDLLSLNKQYQLISPYNRLLHLFNDFAAQDILVTTSFGITSSILLFMIKQVAPKHPIYFIDTTYHFPETLTYKQTLTELFQLNVITLLPDAEANEKSRSEQLWQSNPAACCQINKVDALQPIKEDHKIWVSGLMNDQTDHRKDLSIFEQRNNIIKFHPIIDMAQYDAMLYMTINEIPTHPLLSQGYDSVGCTHCTQAGECRMGRWAQFVGKTECGLHL